MRRSIDKTCIVFILSTLCLGMLISGCSNASKTIAFEKRKHRKGIHLNLRSNAVVATNNITKQSVFKNPSESIVSEVNILNDEAPKDTWEVLASANENGTDTQWKIRSVVRSNNSCASTIDLCSISNEDETSVAAVEPEDDARKVNRSLIGTIALVLAILNLALFMWLPFVGVFTSIITALFAFKALKVEDKDSKLLGGVSIVVTLFTLLVSSFISLIVILGLQLYPDL